MTSIKRYSRPLIGVGLVLALWNFELLTGFLRGLGLLSPLEPILSPLASLWWAIIVLGLIAQISDQVDGIGSVVSGGSLSSIGAGPVRHEIITPTNWRHENKTVMRRSLGLNLLVASGVAIFAAVLLKETTAVFTDYGGPAGFVILVALLGIVLYIVSGRSTRTIQGDHTHRISVRLPDLFSLHSFHVHLRQQAEDLGYAIRNSTSPEHSGTPAGYDDSIFLSSGGFTARKRPIPPSTPLIDDDGIVGEVVSMGSVAAASAIVGVLIFTGSGDLQVAEVNLKGPLSLLLIITGIALFINDYLRRTNHWAELYCVEEGTIYNPTTNLYNDLQAEPLHDDLVPHISDSETSCEMIVTVGAGNSPSFDDDQLEKEFNEFVDAITDLATANRYQIVNHSDRDVTQTETSQNTTPEM